MKAMTYDTIWPLVAVLSMAGQPKFKVGYMDNWTTNRTQCHNQQPAFNIQP